jgi:hypothetical protein
VTYLDHVKENELLIKGLYREDNRRKLNPAVNDIGLEPPVEKRFFKVDLDQDERPLPTLVNQSVDLKTHLFDVDNNGPLQEGHPNDQVISTKLVNVKDMPGK